MAKTGSAITVSYNRHGGSAKVLHTSGSDKAVQDGASEVRELCGMMT